MNKPPENTEAARVAPAASENSNNESQQNNAHVTPAQGVKRGRGRPPGSKNKPKATTTTPQAAPTVDAPASTPAPAPAPAQGSSELATIADQIKAEHKAAQAHQRQSLEHAFRCGELLLAAKRAMPHGEWSAWLSANVKFSETAARGYMRLAAMDPAKRQRVADLTLREALKRLGKYYDQRQRHIEKQVDRELEGEAAKVDAMPDDAVGDTVATKDAKVNGAMPVPVDEPVRSVAGEVMPRQGAENIAATKDLLARADKALDAIDPKITKPAPSPITQVNVTVERPTPKPVDLLAQFKAYVGSVLSQLPIEKRTTLARKFIAHIELVYLPEIIPPDVVTLLEGLDAEGKKNVATICPGTVAHLAHELRARLRH